MIMYYFSFNDFFTNIINFDARAHAIIQVIINSTVKTQKIKAIFLTSVYFYRMHFVTMIV